MDSVHTPSSITPLHPSFPKISSSMNSTQKFRYHSPKGHLDSFLPLKSLSLLGRHSVLLHVTRKSLEPPTVTDLGSRTPPLKRVIPVIRPSCRGSPKTDCSTPCTIFPSPVPFSTEGPSPRGHTSRRVPIVSYCPDMEV